jgi:hypothetical protein
MSNIDKFNFSFEMASKAKKELEDNTFVLKQRIDKIVDHFTIGDTPILRFILNMDPSKDDLKKLSKALDRLGDIVEVYESLVTKLSVIKAAESDPHWFALAFGDFESEVDQDIEKFFNSN